MFVRREQACPVLDTRIGYKHALYGGSMSNTYIGIPGKPANEGIYGDQVEDEKRIRVDQRGQWLQENADAIQAYNRFVEASSTFSDSVRKF